MNTILDRIRGMKMESGIVKDMSDECDEGFTRALLLLSTLDTVSGLS